MKGISGSGACRRRRRRRLPGRSKGPGTELRGWPFPYARQAWRRLLTAAALGSALPLAAETTSVTDVLSAEQASQATAIASQQRVEALDDETLALIAEYNRELERYEDLRVYNDNMRQLLASQAAERERLEGELGEVEVIRRGIVPLMVEMLDVLERFVALDQPMLANEREARLAELRGVLTRSDVALAEKYRRIIEAYQIEAEYGQSIEAYEGSIRLDGRELTVDYLRIGRVGLYYLSLDRTQGGIWDPATGAWSTLDDAQLDQLDYAVRVARKQAPPNLLPLPLWTRDSP